MLLCSYFHPNTKSVQLTNIFPYNINNLSSSPLHIMGEKKTDLRGYELRLVIAHMTVNILPVAIKFIGFYMMTIEDNNQLP